MLINDTSMNAYLWMSFDRCINGTFSLTNICPKNIEAILANRLFDLETRNQLGSPVKKSNPLFEINRKNPIRNTFQNGATRCRKTECGFTG
jgi:hypothetical protein